MSFKRSAKDVAKGILVGFISLGVFFLAMYVATETGNELASLTIAAIAIFLFMWAYKLAKGPKEVRIVK